MATEAKNVSAAPRALIVLGMHRSGTSALAGLLFQSGVAMGSTLMAGRIGENDRGFWEQEQIVAIHERLLSEMGYSWDDPRLLPDRWWETERSQHYLEEICRVLDTEFGSEPLWALKDPRLCRLLPLWKKVFARLGVKPAFLHIVRNPLEVADSLKHRDQLPRPLALLLWFQHNLEAVQNSAGDSRQFITFPQLLDYGEAWLQNIFQEWGLSAIAQGRAESAEETPFLSKTLRHHQKSDSALEANEDVPRLVKDLYQVLLEAACSTTEPSSEKLNHIAQQYQEAVLLLTPWAGLSARFQTKLEKHGADYESLQQEMGRVRAGLARAEQLVHERNTKIAKLGPALEDAQRFVRQREKDIVDLNSELNRLREDMNVLQTDLARIHNHTLWPIFKKLIGGEK
jgi:hypothetical protein